MAIIYIAWDADNAGRKIGGARMQDNPGQLAIISNSIDKGNALFNSWALEYGGSSISSGGDEGIISVPATALGDINNIKKKYETALNLTVSIGIGMKMSQAFKSLLVSKLRGKNRTTVWDKEVEKEVGAAIEGTGDNDDERDKIVKEYLGKAEKALSSHIETKKAAPKHEGGSLKEGSRDYEGEFRAMAEKGEEARGRNSQEIKETKTRVAEALKAMHGQLPILKQIKGAAPDTYDAILNVVRGVIDIGRHLAKNEVDETHDSNLPPSGMKGTSGGIESYDLGMDKGELEDEQISIGTQQEMFYTDNVDVARKIATRNLKENPNYYKIDKSAMNEEEIEPSREVINNNILDKVTIPTNQHLSPGDVVDKQHVVVEGKGKKNNIREVGAGMVRDQDGEVVNPLGPGRGAPISARVNISKIKDTK